MNLQSLVSATAGIVFGLIAGWIIGSQQAASVPAPPAATSQSASSDSAGAASPSQAAPTLDESRVKTLTANAEADPKDNAVRVELANLYFDAERYPDAIKWYQEALTIDGKDLAASTDLGVSYYYTNDFDKAIAQFEHSLSIDPKHAKTLLSLGIVRAFGKQDLKGAAEAWQQVIAVAPDSPEARAARQALDSVRGAHPDVGTTNPAAPKADQKDGG